MMGHHRNSERYASRALLVTSSRISTSVITSSGWTSAACSLIFSTSALSSSASQLLGSYSVPPRQGRGVRTLLDAARSLGNRSGGNEVLGRGLPDEVQLTKERDAQNHKRGGPRGRIECWDQHCCRSPNNYCGDNGQPKHQQRQRQRKLGSSGFAWPSRFSRPESTRPVRPSPRPDPDLKSIF